MQNCGKGFFTPQRPFRMTEKGAASVQIARSAFGFASVRSPYFVIGGGGR